MFVEHKFYVGLRDIDKNRELKNTSLLAFFEDIGSLHSEIAGYGVSTMDKTKRTWILVSWRVHIIKRPKFNDIVKIKTWSRGIYKYYALRDFSIYNEKEELIGYASSKWLFVDIEKGKITKIPDEVGNAYELENEKVFKDEIEKIDEPKDYTATADFTIPKSMIDINDHLHNIYYMDVIREGLSDKKEANDFEIMFKKEIKYGDTIKMYYSKNENECTVSIKSEDGKVLHSIIKLMF